MKSKATHFLALSLFCINLYSCSTHDSKSDSPELALNAETLRKESVEELEYLMEAKKAYENERYGIARNFFDKILNEFPSSPYSSLAEIKVADSLYESGKYPEAVEAYRTFIKVHPSHEATTYCQYKIGKSFYKSYKGLRKDQTPLLEAKKVLLNLIEKSDRNLYTSKAQNLLLTIDERLLEAEKKVIDFYKKMDRIKAYETRLKTAEITYSHLGHVKQFLMSNLESFSQFKSDLKEKIPEFNESQKEQSIQAQATKDLITQKSEKKNQKNEPIAENEIPESSHSAKSAQANKADNSFIASLECKKNKDGIRIDFALHQRTFLKSSRHRNDEKDVLEVVFLNALSLEPIHDGYFSNENSWALIDEQTCTSEAVRLSIIELSNAHMLSDDYDSHEISNHATSAMIIRAVGKQISAPEVQLNSSQKDGSVLFRIR